jgi:phosphohistidine phosphatase
MWVTVWRHGEAAPGAVDEIRALTGRGRRTTLEAAQRYRDRLREAGIAAPTRIHFSPLVRTTQTAELVAMVLGVDPVACPALAPGTDSHRPALFLDNSEHQIIVSHQPFVSELIDVWLNPARCEPLMPGGYACIQLLAPAPGAGELVLAEPAVY